jgi:hypothetical protein
MKYSVKVTCKNEEGTSRQDPGLVIGYSGEGSKFAFLVVSPNDCLEIAQTPSQG